MQNETVIADYWNHFLQATNKDAGMKYYACDYMCAPEEAANGLLALILSGKKRATTSCLLSYQMEGQTPPKVGDFSIITDWDGNPKCIFETTGITVLPFHEVTLEMCIREGEGDSLQEWQTGHYNLFIQDGKEEGYVFTWDTLVIFEDFKVVYQ